MLKSINNPAYAHLNDEEVAQAYKTLYESRNCDTMSEEELDSVDSQLFWLDDELCARGLDLPC